MNVIIDTFQFHFKSEHKQVNEIKSNGTCSNLKSDTIFPHL